MPRGGKREGAGRPKGSLSAATVEQKATLSDMAKSHTEAALNALVEIATMGQSESARVSAASAILDRGYGKPAQSLEHSSPDGTMTPVAGFDIRVVDAPSGDADTPTG